MNSVSGGYLLRLAVTALILCFSDATIAQQDLSAVTVTTDAQGVQTWSVSVQILALMTALTLLPSILLMMTSFARITIVLAILRSALGTQQTPSNQILIGLALFLTLFIMKPVFSTVYEQAVVPWMDQEIETVDAAQIASVPIREFMLNQTRETDIELFLEISGAQPITNANEVPFHILVPAFITSELKTAFQIGFILFIPFLIIDLVVASVLMAMGMMMLSPLIVSLPFKLMLFVLVDGWALVLGTLAGSFYL